MVRKRTLESFEAEHGGGKIRELEAQVEAERRKVEALADVQAKIVIARTEKSHLRFGIIGDIHAGSLYTHEAAVAAYFCDAAKQGISHVFICGDLVDGHRIYRGQEFELRDVGMDAQVARLGLIASRLPEDVHVSFITGNHDLSFKCLAGAPIGRMIATETGWDYMGEEQARIEWKTPGGTYSLQLIHPGGGSAYALSYRPQKIVESLEGGTKPNMLAIGHYHKAEFMPSYRNVATIQAGTFQKQTPFMARQGLAAHVGGWIVDVHVGAGEGWNATKAEFLAVYE